MCGHKRSPGALSAGMVALIDAFAPVDWCLSQRIHWLAPSLRSLSGIGSDTTTLHGSGPASTPCSVIVSLPLPCHYQCSDVGGGARGGGGWATKCPHYMTVASTHPSPFSFNPIHGRAVNECTPLCVYAMRPEYMSMLLVDVLAVSDRDRDRG
jgi:hypothetical protein